MAVRRVRTPHYIGGFGDGKAKERGGNYVDKDNTFQIRNNIRRRHGFVGADERLAAQEHPALIAD